MNSFDAFNWFLLVLGIVMVFVGGRMGYIADTEERTALPALGFMFLGALIAIFGGLA